MHAKMTRDRKKNFISCVEKTIAQLERENQKMRETLKLQVQNDESNKRARTIFDQGTPINEEVGLPTDIETSTPSQLQSIVASSVAKAIQNQNSGDISTSMTSIGFRLVA